MSAAELDIGLPGRGLRTVELAARRPHGDRVKYIGGCRCDRCREANTLYEAARKQARARGDWNGLVPADSAREHLVRLQGEGLGRHTISEASGVSATVLQEIIAGAKLKIRALTSRRILAVTTDARADASLVPATKVWKLIRDLYRQGFNQGDIATRLGYARPYLQIGKRQVQAITELQIVRLHAQMSGTLRPAAKTRARWTELLQEGFELSVLTQRLGMDAATLMEALTSRPKHVTAEFEQQIEQLYQRCMS
ncbi:hypothetical protein [Nevskia sp.]|uniref:hypothetical protein n=1 Tax=Nevskia sp. TaxID=1929292 RepID=UPI003F6EFB93